MAESDTLTERLRRMRSLVCPNHKYSDEVERCPCTRGGRDVANREGSGPETGCKDLMDAIHELEE